jgi:hypothetical protein
VFLKRLLRERARASARRKGSDWQPPTLGLGDAKAIGETSAVGKLECYLDRCIAKLFSLQIPMLTAELTTGIVVDQGALTRLMLS